MRQSLQQWRAPPVLTPVLHVLSTIASSGGPTGQASLRWCARARTLQHRCRWLPLPICPPVRPPCPLLARPQPHASVLASTHDLPLAVRFRGSPDSRVGVVTATPRLPPPDRLYARQEVFQAARPARARLLCIAHRRYGTERCYSTSYCLVNRLRPHTKHNSWGLRGTPRRVHTSSRRVRRSHRDSVSPS